MPGFCSSIRLGRPGVKNGLISFFPFLKAQGRPARPRIDCVAQPPSAVRMLVLVAALLASWAAAPPMARADETSDTCLACHGDKGLTTTRGDRLFISLLAAGYVHLLWLACFGAPRWGASALALVRAFLVFRYA